MNKKVVVNKRLYAVLILMAAVVFLMTYSFSSRAAEESKEGKTKIRLNHSSLDFYLGMACDSNGSSTKLCLVGTKGKTLKIKWSSSNSKIVKVDGKGNVTPIGYGKAVVTAVYKGKKYKCSVTVREIRFYSWLEYSGEPSKSRWVWDYSVCLGVGQSVKYKLVEITYDKTGKEESKKNVTQKYKLIPNSSKHLRIEKGTISALKGDTSQEDETSQVRYYFKNTGVDYEQCIWINVFTEEWSDEFFLSKLSITNMYSNCFKLTTDYLIGSFTLDDQFMVSTDWNYYRCKNGEIKWKSSNPSILRFTNVTGSEPDHVYSKASYQVSKTGAVTVFVYCKDVLIVAKDVVVKNNGDCEISGIYNSWRTIEGKKYYFNGKGLCCIGWKKIDGKKYYFNASGAMVTGTQTINGMKYYFDSSGVCHGKVKQKDIVKQKKNGWQKKNGKIYYYVNGARKTGWLKLGKKKYYFDKKGVMQTGWRKIKSKRYYFRDDGTMVTGVKRINGKTYRFNSSGACLGLQKKRDSSWVDTYIKQVNKFEADKIEFNDYVYGYALIYLDNDDVPEIIMHAGKTWHPTVIYTIRNGNMKKADLGTECVSYIPRSGYIVENYDYKGEGAETVRLLKAGAFKTIGSAHYEYDYWGMASDDSITRENSMKWYIGEKRVSKRTYTNYIKGLYKNKKGMVDVKYYSKSTIFKKLNSLR